MRFGSIWLLDYPGWSQLLTANIFFKECYTMLSRPDCYRTGSLISHTDPIGIGFLLPLLKNLILAIIKDGVSAWMDLESD